MEFAYSDLADLLNEMCDWNLNGSDFSNTSIKYPKDKSMPPFLNTSIAYSNASGDKTATTIAQTLYAKASVSLARLIIGSDVLIEAVSYSSGTFSHLR